MGVLRTQTEGSIYPQNKITEKACLNSHIATSQPGAHTPGWETKGIRAYRHTVTNGTTHGTVPLVST